MDTGKDRVFRGAALWALIFRRVRVLDYAIFAFCAAILGITIVFAYQGSGERAGEATIRSVDGTFVYSLDRDLRIDVRGPIGVCTLLIRAGEIRFVEPSPCPNKICVRRGWIYRDGEWAACLPDQIFVSTHSVTKSSLDVRVF